MTTITNYATKDIYKIYMKDGGTLAYPLFKQLVYKYHQAMTDKCIKGYMWSLPHNLGCIKIVISKRKYTVLENGNIRGSVDWGASNKLKASIIERGEVPLESYKDESNKVIGDNEGVKWLCYHTSTDYFCWTHITNIYLKNGTKYGFDFSWHNSRKLSASITKDSYFLYEQRKDGNVKDFFVSKSTPVNRN